MSEFTLKVTEQEFQIIMEALGAQPLSKTLQTFAKIQQQVQEQVNPRPTVASNGAVATKAP